MMVPVGRLVLLRTAAKGELVGAMALLAAPALLGPVLGPPVGGFFVTYLSWRWIFYINLPIGIFGMALVTLYVPDVRDPGAARLDGLGLVLSGARSPACCSDWKRCRAASCRNGSRCRCWHLGCSPRRCTSGIRAATRRRCSTCR